jgi:hypothetical protein
MLCLCGCESATRKYVTFNFLAVFFFFLLFTTVGKICVHEFLIHVHSSSFITRSFSLTVNNRRCIPSILMSGDEYNTSYTVPTSGLVQPTGFACVHYVGRKKLHICLCLGTVRQ